MLRNYYGLSMNDHYWIRSVEGNLDWEQINLFTNSFQDEIAGLQFSDTADEQNLYMDTTFYPSATTQGELQKKSAVSVKILLMKI